MSFSIILNVILIFILLYILYLYYYHKKRISETVRYAREIIYLVKDMIYSIVYGIDDVDKIKEHIIDTALNSKKKLSEYLILWYEKVSELINSETNEEDIVDSINNGEHTLIEINRYLYKQTSIDFHQITNLLVKLKDSMIDKKYENTFNIIDSITNLVEVY